MDNIRKLAEGSNALAQLAMGIMHLHGHGEMLPRAGIQSIPKDHSEARRWFLASAEQGCAWAMYNYAGLCGSAEDRFRWHLRAANHGLADAQVALIRYYCNLDRGAEIIDVVEAYKWALLAAKQNHPCVVETNQFEILEYRMTSDQIEEAKRRAASFVAQESKC